MESVRNLEFINAVELLIPDGKHGGIFQFFLSELKPSLPGFSGCVFFLRKISASVRDGTEIPFGNDDVHFKGERRNAVSHIEVNEAAAFNLCASSAEGEGRRMERDHRAGKQSQRAENADSCFFQKGVEFHWNHFFRINLLSIGSAV